MTNDTRAAFEAWYRTTFPNSLPVTRFASSGRYTNDHVAERWFTWLASRRAALEEAAKVCEGVADGHDFTHNTQAENAADECAAAIRALGDEGVKP